MMIGSTRRVVRCTGRCDSSPSLLRADVGGTISMEDEGLTALHSSEKTIGTRPR